MKGYTVKDIEKMLDLSAAQVRSYARAGFLDARRGAQGEYRFSFQDLVLLRTAKGLTAARIPPRQVRRALRRLREQLPEGRPLSGVQIVAQGDHVLVRTGDRIWNPESGQTHFNFEVSEIAEKAAPRAREMFRDASDEEMKLDAEDWYEFGLDLEAVAVDQAREAYRRALELSPGHVDARINLGRLLHEAGRLEAAEQHYRMALEAKPDNTTALFNLGVAVEDLGRREEALEIYRSVVRLDARYADAYFNLARLSEQAGDKRAALRYLKTYRQLTEE